MHECRAAKIYSGNRGRYSNSVEVRERRSMRTRPLELRLDPFNHSSTGLEWGYGGSGPAHLALAILADHEPSLTRFIDRLAAKASAGP